MTIHLGLHSLSSPLPTTRLNPSEKLLFTVSDAAPLRYPSWVHNAQLACSNFKHFRPLGNKTAKKKTYVVTVAESKSVANSGPTSGGWWWDKLRQGASPATPCLSDVLWPAVGAFVAMAIMGHADKMIASKGLTLTIAPFGAVCAVLFATPTSPAAQKYNIFVSQIGCAAIGVIALTIFGPGWIARSFSLAACLAFMICTGSLHPPAASLPLLLIDGPKFQHLQWWYSIYPGAAGCLLLCMIQEVITFLKSNYKF